MASHVGTTDFAQGGPNTQSPLSQSNLHNQNSQMGEIGDAPQMQRTSSSMSQSYTLTPSRGGTLKKRQSLSRKNSLKRSGSKKGSRPGSIRSLTFAEDVAGVEANNAFYTPVPTRGTPTEILANRFQVWRKVLKDLITYFRDLQKSYESQSKSLYTLSNVVSNITAPPGFAFEGGISDAISILREYHKKSISEGNKAKSIEEEVIVQLTGLRSDLGQKIKEIKGLSGDFKNNVDKETEGTRRAVRDLQESLRDKNPDAKGDPFMVKLAVEKQLGRQIEEENYLHRAFLNLESSGRELESIVMGEIQKAYNAYAGIMKREADEAYEAVENLRTGPLALPKDSEWNAFVDENEAFVDPRVPVRKFENINYPGKDDPAALEVKGGMLERKSKYLKSYTPGWYVLSATHLHEFKSPDRISSQTPVMSLPLADQKLGSHSSVDSTSHKFMLKGRQSGGMHKSHAWVFRAESYDTMMAWFSDIKNLTEKTGIERDAFIRRTHARSVSGGSHRAGSISDGSALDEDEADQVPYSATASQAEPSTEKMPQRPHPGGRFPSLLSIRDSQVPNAPSSPSENSGDRDVVAAAGTLPGSVVPYEDMGKNGTSAEKGNLDSATPAPVLEATYAPPGSNEKGISTHAHSGDTKSPIQAFDFQPDGSGYAHRPHQVERHDSKYGDWMSPVTAGTGGVIAAASSADAHKRSEAHQIGQQGEHSGLHSVEMPTSNDSPKTSMTPVAANTNDLPANGAPSGAVSGSTILTSNYGNPASPSKEFAHEPSLDSRASVTSDQIHVPGGYPPSRTNTQPL